MQATAPLNVVIGDIVRDAGGQARTADLATRILTERETTIAANLREYAATKGLTGRAVDDVFRAVGLTFRPATDPAIAQATARIERAKAELAQARADLDRVSR